MQTWLEAQSVIERARCDDRTQNAVINYDPRCRSEVIQLLASFCYEDAADQVTVPEHSTRALSRTYEDKMFFHILRRGITRFVLPFPVRTVITAVKSVPYIGRALRSLLKGKMEVSVLDAASITVSMIRGEFNTAGSVMFLLGIGDIMEEWTHRKSVEDLASAMALNVDKVWQRTEDGQEILTGIDRIREGDTILVRTGNMIPLDGTVLEGDGMVNQASITGEPLPVHKRPGSLVYAGTVVDEGELAVTVRQTQGTGRYDRIVKMIEESEKLKSETEDKASHLADRLVPWTFGATALTWLLTRERGAGRRHPDGGLLLRAEALHAHRGTLRDARGRRPQDIGQGREVPGEFLRSLHHRLRQDRDADRRLTQRAGGGSRSAGKDGRGCSVLPPVP